MEELEQGLAFVTDAELPEIADPEKRAAWNQRWQRFAREEWLGKLSTPEDTWKETADSEDSDSGDSGGSGDLLPDAGDDEQRKFGDGNC